MAKAKANGIEIEYKPLEIDQEGLSLDYSESAFK